MFGKYYYIVTVQANVDRAETTTQGNTHILTLDKIYGAITFGDLVLGLLEIFKINNYKL